MNSILYFGSDTVKFLRGSAGKNRVTIQDAATVRLDEGILLNGVITDERRLCEALNGLQPRIGKHVDIVVESSEIHTKAVEIPFLRPAAIRQTVRREFGRDADRDEEPIYDYAVLENRVGNENRGRILCCAMSRALLEGYRALFSAMGVTLSSCDVGLHALIRAVSLFPSFDRSAYVLTTVERNRMSCALFEGNRYLFSNSARLVGDPESEEYASGMAARLSAIQQFYKSEKGDVKLDHVYLYGLDGAVVSRCREAASFLGVPVDPLPDSPRIVRNGPVDAGTYLAAVGGLIGK